ncbi:MAG: ABC transporter ATP-binding protein [Candidatus Magasanikbacteria bacterium]|nr:ABC transporter ATP-binding protein [Candidatus Magasanikbacteria bacterium]
MNYTLNKPTGPGQKTSFTTALKRMRPFIGGETKNIFIGFGAILIASVSALITPIIIGHVIDTYIRTKNYHGIAVFSGILFCIFVVWLIASYLQIKMMGSVGRRVLFNLRNALFTKLQSLPLSFFNQNKAGDLISRINNDTDQLNQFFAQALMQLLGNSFLIVGAIICLLVLNIRLGLASLIPVVALFIITRSISGWVKRKNLTNLQSLGSLSAEIQESLSNFKVIAAFNRLDYFREKFDTVNKSNFSAALGAGIANNTFSPIYGFAANAAQIIVLAYGIHLIGIGSLSIGLLISFLMYVNNLYTPLRQLAMVWATFQQALAGIDRISEVLSLENDMAIIPKALTTTSSSVLEFTNVSFHYPDGVDVLKNITLKLEPGKTYALVGPTGGGKTTLASLMARLYDPTDGTIFLNGQNIQSYEPQTRTQKIGFILQEPFLFSGTIRENILYGNEEFKNYTSAQLEEVLKQENLSDLLDRFNGGLETKVAMNGETISLGQKQLIAFIRATLRKPDLLILDEATANIDTVTEQLLEEIIQKLPKTTARVIIAHRLNTIENADEIFFVNAGEVTNAGSMEHAVDMLLHGKRKS